MKSRILICMTAMTLFAALAVPVRLAAQEQTQVPPRYTVIDLGALGGTLSNAYGINNAGWVEGTSLLPGDTLEHAYLWRNGVMKDLGTLVGPNGNSYASSRPSASGEVGGGSDTTTTDPNGEDYCGFGTYLECRPFTWRNGVMTKLPTFGGPNGEAAGVNIWGQVIGNAEFSTPKVCPGGNGGAYLNVGAALWENGKIRLLPYYPGDSDGVGNAINDWGQATGTSAVCGHPLNAVLWQDGRVMDLGNLGGTEANWGYDINNLGQVVGVSALAFGYEHAFLWQKRTGMIDLGTLQGDVGSSGDGINDLGQVVGGSYDINGNDRVFLWQNGVMTDLNTLIPPDSPLYLVEATGTINNRGQIAGIAYVISTGEFPHAFLATPTTLWWWPLSERPKVVLPENVRKQLQQRLRFGPRLAGGSVKVQ